MRSRTSIYDKDRDSPGSYSVENVAYKSKKRKNQKIKRKNKRRKLRTERNVVANITNTSAVTYEDIHYDDGILEGRDEWVDEAIYDVCKTLKESDCSTVCKSHPPLPATVDTSEMINSTSTAGSNGDGQQITGDISSFDEIRESNLLYVDKTEHIFKLLSQRKYSFLVRPRRFGKSLLCSTIANMYLGEKSAKYFDGLWLAHSGWDFNNEERPVVHLDMSKAAGSRSNAILFSEAVTAMMLYLSLIHI